MSTTDTSAIDEKKTDETGTQPDFKGFIANYISSIIVTIGISIFVIGGLGLYTTKVAQSNILPDNVEFAPYSIFDRIVAPMPVDMNIMRSSLWAENKETLSQKAVFNSKEYLDSFSNGLLCSLKKNANPNASLFANAPLFFSFVYDNLVAKNFLAINTIFYYFSFLPESFIMLFYGFFGIFIWIALYFFNLCISIFYHFINIPQLFRTASYEDESRWEPQEHISFIRFFKFLLFFFVWIPIGLLSTFIVPLLFTLYGLISPLFATYNLKQSKEMKTYNVLDFIKDTFVYKKSFFFILATISLITNGMKFLGTNSLVGIVIAIAFAYFMGLYSNEMPDIGTDGFTSKIRQNMKQAPVEDINESNPNLVEICQQIPVMDEVLNEKIKKGVLRKMSKIKGGQNTELENYEVENSDTNMESSVPDNVIQTDSNITTPSNQTDSNITTPSNQTDSNITTPSNQTDSSVNNPESLDNLLQEYKNRLQMIDNESSNSEESLANKANLMKKIQDIEKLINVSKSQRIQQGGKKYNTKKQKTIKSTKKYNIRLV